MSPDSMSITSTAKTTGIRPATLNEASSTTAVITLAFAADPVARWVYPDPMQYLENFPKFIRAFAGDSFANGTAYVSSDLSGAALWLRPGSGPDEDAMTELFSDTVTDTVKRDLFPVLEMMGECHPKEPHWYLPMIGVEAQYQGFGIGSSLMGFAVAGCDRDGLPAYLESSNPRNIPLYERFGFRQTGKIQVGDSAPLFPMIREASK